MLPDQNKAHAEESTVPTEPGSLPTSTHAVILHFTRLTATAHHPSRTRGWRETLLTDAPRGCTAHPSRNGLPGGRW